MNFYRPVILLLFLFSALFVRSQDPVVNDSLFKIYNNSQLKDSVRLQAAHEIAWSYVFSNPDTAFILADKLAAEAQKKKQDYWLAKAWNTCGITFHITSRYEKAVEFYKKSMAIREKIGDKEGVAASLSNIGAIYFNKGDYVMALDYYYKSLKIEHAIGNKKGEAQTYNDLGLVYDELAEAQRDSSGLKKAIGLYKKCLAILDEEDDKYVRAAAYGNLGNTYSFMRDYKNAFSYHQKSLELRKEINDKQGMAAELGNIGNIYKEITGEELHALGIDSNTRNQLALDMYAQCYAIMKEIGDLNGMAISLSNLSSAHIEKKELLKAKKYAEDALLIAYDINARELKRDNHGWLYKIYKLQGNTREALHQYELFIRFRDSIDNEENKKDIARKEIQFEYEKKALADSIKHEEEKALAKAELNARNLEIEARDAKIKQEETLKYALMLGILLVIGFAIFIYNRLNIIRKQKTIIEEQKQIVEEKNREVLDSINYAKRLQDAILPPEKLWKSVFPESFIFYKPKDIIAGDFYFLEKSGDNIVFAVADCTGHGVPGAMVSVVCANALNRAVKEFKLTDSGLILDKVRELVLETFEKSESQVNDGMDISLGVLNTKSLELKWSGANNPLWIVKQVDELASLESSNSQLSKLSQLPNFLNLQLTEFSPNKQPIGKIYDPEPFETHSIYLKKGDTLFLFSDGFADQFGGPKGKKFKYSQLQQLFLEICSLQPESEASQHPLINKNDLMQTQNQKLETVFSGWKGNLEQIDDVCIIGIRI